MNDNTFQYKIINLYNSTFSPSNVHMNDNALYWYFFEKLLNRVISVFKFTLPENWSASYFLYVLYLFGWIVIYKEKKDGLGIIPQSCTFEGLNVFYEPKKAIITNPALSGFRELEIGKECVLVKMKPNYTGFYELIDTYAQMLTNAWETANINMLQSKLGMYVFAKNKSQAETIKKALDKILGGSPIEVIDSNMKNEDGKLGVDYFNADLKSHYIFGDILNDCRKIYNNFCTDVGIANTNLEKKERLLVNEISANNAETYTMIDMCMDGIKGSFNKAVKMFPELKGNLNVEWRDIKNDYYNIGNVSV